MTKLTGLEILEIVSKNYSELTFAFNEWSENNDGISILSPEQQAEIADVKEKGGSYWALRDAYILQQLGLGEVQEIEQYGGEGQGDTWYSVKHFKDHDVYIRIDGSYASYNGTDFEDGYGREVRPQEKVITVYE